MLKHPSGTTERYSLIFREFRGAQLHFPLSVWKRAGNPSARGFKKIEGIVGGGFGICSVQLLHILFALACTILEFERSDAHIVTISAAKVPGRV